MNIFRLSLLLGFLVMLTGCFTPEGTLRIKTDRDGIDLLVDGQRKVKVNKTFLEIKLEAGVHKLEVNGLSDDGEWRYVGEKSVEIVKDSLVEIYISTSRIETEKRKARIEKERVERELSRGANRISKLAREEWQKRMQKKSEE